MERIYRVVGDTRRNNCTALWAIDVTASCQQNAIRKAQGFWYTPWQDMHLFHTSATRHDDAEHGELLNHWVNLTRRAIHHPEQYPDWVLFPERRPR